MGHDVSTVHQPAFSGPSLPAGTCMWLGQALHSRDSKVMYIIMMRCWDYVHVHAVVGLHSCSCCARVICILMMEYQGYVGIHAGMLELYIHNAKVETLPQGNGG